LTIMRERRDARTLIGRALPATILCALAYVGAPLLAAEQPPPAPPATTDSAKPAKPSNETAKPSPPAKPEAPKEEPAAAKPEAGDGEEKLPPAPTGADKKASPQRFTPSEQVRADFDVSFPIDI
jgi:hypothetical protein